MHRWVLFDRDLGRCSLVLGVPPGCGTTDVVLTNQAKNFDWRARHFAHTGASPAGAVRVTYPRAPDPFWHDADGRTRPSVE